MTVMIALLRGVNVAGRSKLSMADLRRVAEECGFTGVQTYVQSGNVVFSASGRDTDAVADSLRSRLARATDVRPDVAVRTRDELRRVVDGNPFHDRDADPTHLHVVFLVGASSSGSRTGATEVPAFDSAPFAPEEARVVGREVYLYLPKGAGRSKLAAALARHKPALGGTMRNWRTVTKLLDLADAAAP